MENTLLYIVEEVIDQIKQLEYNLRLNELDLNQHEFWTSENKKYVKNLLGLLDLLVKGQSDNPQILKLIKEVVGLEDFLKSILKAYGAEPSRALSRLPSEILLGEVNRRVEDVINLLDKWKNTIEEKVSIVGMGNKHLLDLPLHKYLNKFYVKVKELNPTTLQTKHPLNSQQAEMISKLPNEKLMKYNTDDPISGRRDFRKHDDFNYPGSQIIISTGHHRVFEIYKRYLQGKIDGDELIEFLIT